MKIKLNINALVFALIVGILIVPTFAFTTGDQFSSVRYPLLAILSGFIIIGFTTGYFSKVMPVYEPGIASIIISIASSLIIPELQLKAFALMTSSDWLILFMNGFIFTYIGSWLSFKTFNNEEYENNEISFEIYNWNSILYSSAFGLLIAVISSNLFVYILGYNSYYNFIHLIICLFVTGTALGIKSPEANHLKLGLSAIISITLCLDVIKITFMYEDDINMIYLISGIITGLIVCILGNFAGIKLSKIIKNNMKIIDNA